MLDGPSNLLWNQLVVKARRHAIRWVKRVMYGIKGGGDGEHEG